jgi:hypothetical protein
MTGLCFLLPDHPAAGKMFNHSNDVEEGEDRFFQRLNHLVRVIIASIMVIIIDFG